MSIALGDPRKMPPVRNSEATQTELEKLQRSDTVAQAFPSRHSRGLGINFNAPSPVAAKSSGLSSTLDAYAPVSCAEDAQREETARRIDALPSEIAALPKRHAGLALDALEALAVIERSAKAMNGPVAVTRGDIARAIKSTPERAEAIVADLERLSLIRRQVTAGTVPYFTVRL